MPPEKPKTFDDLIAEWCASQEGIDLAHQALHARFPEGQWPNNAAELRAIGRARQRDDTAERRLVQAIFQLPGHGGVIQTNTVFTTSTDTEGCACLEVFTVLPSSTELPPHAQ